MKAILLSLETFRLSFSLFLKKNDPKQFADVAAANEIVFIVRKNN